VGHERIKTEHAGAKNDGGAWITRAEAKQSAKRKRRQIDKQDAAEALVDDRLHFECGESASTQSTELTKEPWTNPDPQPGDFDAELDAGRSLVQVHSSNSHARLRDTSGTRRIARP
jgi:hypothetical protein